MKNNWIILLALLALTISGCSSDKADPAKAPAPVAVQLTREAIKEDIATNRQAVSGVHDLREKRPEALKLLSAYQRYCKQFPEDEIVPTYLYLAGEVALQLEQFSLAIQLFDQILQAHKGFERAPDALFMQAMIYDEHLDQKGRAETLYHAVIDQYPDHQLAKEAASILPTLHMSDKELIEMFKAKEQNKAAGS